MKKRFIQALIFAVLSAACPHRAHAEAADSLDIGVMSFNIRYGSAEDGGNSWYNRKDLVCDVIREYEPGVVGLQEALRFQIDEIMEAFPGYGEIGVGREGGVKGEYCAILYRADRFDVDESGTFWLSDTPEKPSRHWGNACIRICTWARLVDKGRGVAFYFYNTHLDHESQHSREMSVRLIAARINGRGHDDPCILAGDFNAGEDNPAIRYLKGEESAVATSPLRFADAFRVLHPDDETAGTFNGFKGRSDGPKIDYIFVAPGVRVLDSSIVRTERDGRYPSDHFPVTARLRLVAQP